MSVLVWRRGLEYPWGWEQACSQRWVPASVSGVGSGVEFGMAVGKGAGVGIAAEGGVDAGFTEEVRLVSDCSVPHPKVTRSNITRIRQTLVPSLRIGSSFIGWA